MTDRRVLWPLLLAVPLLSCAQINTWLAGPPPREWPRPLAPLPTAERGAELLAPQVVIDGPTLDAMQSARADLVERRRYAQRASGHAPTAVSACLTRPEIYDVQLVAEDAERWVILVWPRVARCPALEGLFGGDGTFEIAKANGKIQSVEFGE